MYYLNKIKNHIYNWFDYIKEHLIKFIIIFLLFILFSLLFVVFLKEHTVNQQILILGITLENWFTGLSIFAIFITAIWALYQFDKNTTLKQQEKASEIAKSFSNKLTVKCSIICCVINHSELFNLLELDIKKYDDFKIFNTNEIRNIYNDDNFIEKYKKVKSESNLNSIYYRLLESLVSNKSFRNLMNENKEYSLEEARHLFILDNSDLPFNFASLISSVLNELEYLCMSLSSQAAGSKYVYQSLHQVFLRTMRCLSVEIAISNNNCYSDKFYTNAIHVYNEWTNLYMLNLKKENKQKDKVNKLLNPKIKTV